MSFKQNDTLHALTHTCFLLLNDKRYVRGRGSYIKTFSSILVYIYMRSMIDHSYLKDGLLYSMHPSLLTCKNGFTSMYYLYWIKTIRMFSKTDCLLDYMSLKIFDVWNIAYLVSLKIKSEIILLKLLQEIWMYIGCPQEYFIFRWFFFRVCCEGMLSCDFCFAWYLFSSFFIPPLGVFFWGGGDGV